MINFDDHEHARMRRLVASGFTPKQIASYEPGLRAIAAEIIDQVLDKYGDGTEFDFVAEIASRLPVRAICSMLGVPDADHDLMLQWSNDAVSPDDPGVGIDGATSGLRRIADYPNLGPYLRDLYQQPGIADTVRLDQIKRHYFTTHLGLNPSGIIPAGPVLAWDAPAGRERLAG